MIFSVEDKRNALLPVDIIPLDSAVNRLFHAAACSDDQLSDYALSQALRAVLYAVKGSSAPLWNGAGGDVSSGLQRPSSYVAPRAHVLGREAVLYRLAMRSCVSAQQLSTAVYLSARILCEEASSFGEGNERPCVAEEWTAALLAFAGGGASESLPSTTHYFTNIAAVDRRFGLGYLLLACGTLRVIASGGVPRKHVFRSFVSLGKGWMEHILPCVACLCERESAEHALQRASATGGSSTAPATDEDIPLPSRLEVEANNFIIHSFHWLCRDILTVHQGDGDDGTPHGRGAPQILDRDAPQQIWCVVTLLRNALRRALHLIGLEMERYQRRCHRQQRCSELGRAERIAGSPDIHTDVDPPTNSMAALHKREQAAQLLNDVSGQIEGVFSTVIKHQEALYCTRQNVERLFGTGSKDYVDISEHLWRHTLLLCDVVLHVTSAWICTQGGMGVGSTTSLVLQRDGDILAYLTKELLSVPALEGRETEGQTIMAMVALLSVATGVVAAAPLQSMQVGLWAAQPSLTQQMHNLIVQRALRYRDERVLRLASLLSNSILYSSVQDAGGSSRLLADSTEQLLELLTETRDAASHCVIEMVVRAAIERPHTVIPSLFRILQHGDVGARRNALEVLAGLPLLESADSEFTAGTTSGLPSRGSGLAVPSSSLREVLRLLAEHLLLRLQDEELCVRLQSASLFARVWPEDVIESLLRVALQRDYTGRKQAAAKSALMAVVAAHTESADVVLLLLQGSSVVIRSLKAELDTERPTLPDAAGSGTLRTFGEEDNSLLFSSKRGAPTTPGDVLSFALLRSTEALGEAEGLCGQPLTEDAPGNGGDRSSKMGRLTTLVRSLCEHWVTQVQQWSVAHHVSPLLHYARNVGGPNARQQCMKCLTHIISSITLHAEQQSIPSRRAIHLAVLEAIGQVTLSIAVPQETSLNNCTWPPAEGYESADVVYHALMPLLCLRSCSHSTFLYLVDEEGRAMPTASDVDPLAAWSHVIWLSLWHVLTEKRYERFFSLSADVQRLLLETLCRFPFAAFWRRLQFEKDHLQSSENNREMLFARILAFGICVFAFSRPSYIYVTPTMDTERDTVAADGDVPATGLQKTLAEMAQCLVRTVKQIILPWLRCDEVVSVSCNGARHQEEDMHKLSRSTMDAIGVLELVSLAHRDDVLWLAIAPICITPMEMLSSYYRASGGDEEGCSPPSSYLDCNADETVTQFFFFLHVQRSVLTVARSHPSYQAVLALWLQRYLQPIIDVANASVSDKQGRAKHGCQVAAQSCELLFQMLMLSRERDRISTRQDPTAPVASPVVDIKRSLSGTNIASVHASSTTAGPHSVAHRLPYADKEALVRFGIGCARFSASDVVQREGVKLLSAILGVASDLFEELGEDYGLQLLQEVIQVLHSVALMHADAPTRTLAEQVIHALSTPADR